MLPVICEALLVAAGLAAMMLARRVALPAGMFWSTGFGLVTLAAGLGALRYGGLEMLAPSHRFVSALAGNVGATAWLLGALFGLLLRLPEGLAGLGGAAGIALLIGLGQDDLGALPVPVPVLAMAGLLILALLGLRIARAAGIWLLAAVGLALIAEMARQGKLALIPLPPTELYHLVLAGVVLALGFGARAHG